MVKLCKGREMCYTLLLREKEEYITLKRSDVCIVGLPLVMRSSGSPCFSNKF